MTQSHKIAYRENKKVTMHDYNSAYYNKAVNCSGACGLNATKDLFYVCMIKVC